MSKPNDNPFASLVDDDLRKEDSTRVEPFEGLDGDQESVEVAPVEQVSDVFDGHDVRARRLLRAVVDAERRFQSLKDEIVDEDYEEFLHTINELHDWVVRRY